MDHSFEELDALVALITEAVNDFKASCISSSYTTPSLKSTSPHPADSTPPSLAIRKAVQTIEGASAQLCAIVASPAHTLIQRGFAMVEPTCLNVVIQARVADKLEGKDGLHIEELSKETGIEPGKLCRVLRFLATKHIFTEVRPNTFANNRLSALLRSSDPIWSLLSHFTNETFKATAALYDSLSHPVHGPSYAPNHTPANLAFDFNESFFKFLFEIHPEMGEKFSKGMVGWGNGIGSGDLVDGWAWKDLPGGAKVCDVGGGVGASSMQLARSFPDLEVVLQDLPDPISQAKDLWLASLPNANVSFVTFDFLKEPPAAGCDVYFLKNILHDWPDLDCVTILSNVVEAMTKKDARVLIQEYILQFACVEQGSNQPRAPSPLLPNYGEGRLRQYDLDICMMTLYNSKERTLQEFVELGEQAGLKFVALHDLGENGLIEMKRG